MKTMLAAPNAIAALSILLVCGPASGASPSSVLQIARSFPDGGGYEWSRGTGAPCEIVHHGEQILKAQEKGTYCSGFTFAVVMRTADQRGLVADKQTAAVRRFQKQWYGSTKEAAEKQCALAVERLGIGEAVKPLEAARPGDFIQLWRTDKSGHSVVLVELLRDGDQIVGLRYRSSQKSTDGIGDRSEYFADVPQRHGRLDRRRIYIARLFEQPRP